MLTLDPDEKIKQDQQNSKILNSTFPSPKIIIELPTKPYVDSLHESSRNRRGLSSIFTYQDNELHINKLTTLDSVSVNKNRSSDKELANKKNFDDSIGDRNVLRFNRTLENYLKISNGNDRYNITKIYKT